MLVDVELVLWNFVNDVIHTRKCETIKHYSNYVLVLLYLLSLSVIIDDNKLLFDKFSFFIRILFYVTFNASADENLEHRSESGSPQVNRSSMTSGQQQGLNKDSMKKVGNRTTQESSQVINGRSTSQQSQGKSLLMGQIIGANKDVTEETLFLGTEIPKYGVVTSHEMELERVTECIFFFKYMTYN